MMQFWEGYPIIFHLKLYILLVVGYSDGYFNLFLSQSQVKKLLGLDTELDYVREGVINNYALNFVVPVPVNLSDLEFSWQSTIDQPLLYSMELDYDMTDIPDGDSSDLVAFLPPKVNISARGKIPMTLQVFSIRLPCSGLASAAIPMTLRLNVTAPTNTEIKYNDTFVTFKRKRICARGVETPSRNDLVHLKAKPLVNGTSALYVAATCACALILVVGSILSALYLRNSKNRVQESQKTLVVYNYSATGTNLVKSSVLAGAENKPGSANSGSYATIADMESLYARPCGSRASSYYNASDNMTRTSSQPIDPCDKAKTLAVSKSSIICKSLVLEGTFGRIYRGTLELAGRECQVIIKTVTDVASNYQASLLVLEGSQLAGLIHENLVSLAAACLDNPFPMLAYACSLDELNLKIYLIEGNHHLITRDLVNVALQIARAGEFLHGRCLLHKDIASRNCLIEPISYHVRLADAALARDLFPQDYHCLGDNENRPIRWMALESLKHNQYSTATDVWSFGVFLWELTTMGQQPYVEVDPFEMVAFLRDGYRLVQPRLCSDELFAVMAVCWLDIDIDRPTMPQVVAYLQEFYDALSGFV